MYVQIVTFGLGELGESQYLDVANDLAPRFSGTPGLQAKIWLEDPERGRYGAVYLWDDRESMDRFERSGLFEGTNRNFVGVESEGFNVYENLTAQTQPVLEVVKPRRQAAVARKPQRAVRTATPTAKAVRAARPRTIPIKTATASAAKAPARSTPAKAGRAKRAPAKRSAKKSAG